MEFLQMSAMAFDNLPSNNIGPSAECNFEVSIGDGNFQPVSRDGAAPATFPLPDSPRPLTLSVRAKPTTPNHFPFTGKFEYQGGGNLVPTLAGPEFRPMRAFKSGSSSAVVSLYFYLSRVSDQTDSAVFNLSQIPASRKGAVVPDSWDLSALPDMNYAGNPAVSGGALQFSQQTIDPSGEDLVLGVAGVKTPKLIAVSWPNSIVRTLLSPVTPFFIYIHAGMAQNVPNGDYIGPGLGTYPFGWDYLFYGLWRYMTFQGDPLNDADGVYTKGLPYQAAASGKKVVTILPESTATGAEAGVFRDAESIQDILREIDAFMYRRKGIYNPPGIGRTGMAAFSSGNDFTNLFLDDRSNQQHPFYLEILKELYAFETPHINDWVDSAIKWWQAGRWEDKVLQLYTQGVGKRYNELLDGKMPKAPFVQQNINGLATIGVLPSTAWAAARPGKNTDWQACHQLVSSTMFTTALRNSKF